MQKSIRKIKDNIWNTIFFLLLFALAIVIIGLISLQGTEQEKPIVVGGVFVGPVDDNGWNENHYEGLKRTCDKLKHPFRYVDSVEETLDACQDAVDELIAGGCRIIFLTSDGYGSNIQPMAEEHPDIIFYTVSPEAEAENMRTYYGRIYQARYMAGIISGAMTESNVLGFVSAYSTPQVDRDVNAFLLGARSVNPDAVVKVKFTGSWANEDAERKAAEALIDEDGADVLAYHSSMHNTMDVAEERGVYSVGYNPLTGKRSDKVLSAVVFNWNIIYKSILQDFIRGNLRANGYYWWGVTEGAVGLDHISPVVPNEVMRHIVKTREGFNSGKDVFLGKVVRNDGKVMCRRDERMSDEALLLKMDWFVEGVEVDADY